MCYPETPPGRVLVVHQAARNRSSLAGSQRKRCTDKATCDNHQSSIINRDEYLADSSKLQTQQSQSPEQQILSKAKITGSHRA